MIIIPAIDLKDGQCVRLLQGKKEDATVYSDDPASTAKKWQSCGAQLLHVVDLDGAFTGSQSNIESIIEIRKAVSMKIQVGGGIRDMEKIDSLFSVGIERVILGTAAINNPDLVSKACSKYPGRVLVGIDAKNGFVAIKGWTETTKVTAVELGRKMAELGAAGIIYTDISRDGMLQGPNIETTKEMAYELPIPVIASGGISVMDDINNLLTIKGLWGAITGKAIYSGTLDLTEAIKITEAK